MLAVDPSAPADLRRFAEEVAPGVRDAVGPERGEPPAESPPPSSEDDATPVLDEAARPRLPRSEDAAITADGAGGQQLLLQVHDHLRSELAQLREAIEQLEAGLRDPAWVRTVLARLTNRQNWCSVGAFCAGYCRLVAIHHTIEGRRLFPDLLGKEAELEPVLKRLQLEHEVIAEALQSLDDALGAMLGDPERIVDVRAALQHLAGSRSRTSRTRRRGCSSPSAGSASRSDPTAPASLTSSALEALSCRAWPPPKPRSASRTPPSRPASASTPSATTSGPG